MQCGQTREFTSASSVFATDKEDETFQQSVDVNHKFEAFFYLPYSIFFICFCTKRKIAFCKLHQRWVSLASIPFPAFCYVVFRSSEQMNLKKKAFLFFVQAYQKKLSVESDQKRKESLFYVGKSRDNDPIKKHHATMIKKEAYISNNLHLNKSFLKFSSQTQRNSSFSYLYSISPTKPRWLTIPLHPWTNSFVPTRWLLQNSQTV